MKPPRWVEQATDVSDAEASDWLRGEPGPTRLCVDATEPLDDEVARLLQREVPHPAGYGSLAWKAGWGGAALAAAAAMVILGLGEPPPAPVAGTDPPAAEWVSFTADGPGDWWIDRRDASGVEIHQQEGTVLYRVDPLPDQARFVVRAGRLEVEVVGTVFEVGAHGADAWVNVYEGQVLVTDGGPTLVLSAGDGWERHPFTVAPPERQPTQPTSPPADAWRREYAALLGRFEAPERTGALLTDLWSFAAAHPDDPLGIDARVLALRVAADIQDPESVVTAIDVFLATAPDAHQRPMLLQLGADLARDRLRDCTRAGPLFHALARETEGVARARAQAWEGLCAASLGQPTALDVLRRSLSGGVDGELRARVEVAVRTLSAERSPSP
ncbi:MAG: hypothetical protein ABMA64_16440 [Myxococcota bacterium]